MAIARLNAFWTLDNFTDALRRMTGEKLSRITVYYWTTAEILRPVMPPGRKRGTRYGIEDLLVMLLRAQLLKEGVSPRRIKAALKRLRDLAPDLLDPTKASGERLIVLGRRPVLIDRDDLAQSLPDGQGAFIFDPRYAVAKALQEAKRKAA